MSLNNSSGKYDDILNLPHYISEKRAKMSIYDRAAQFSPFAALTGYDAAVLEAARLTERRVELSEDLRSELDRTMTILEKILDTEPIVTVTYFLPDSRKTGGEYRTVRSRLIRIDQSAGNIILANGDVIPISTVTSLVPDVLIENYDE
ncbi:MAG: hypothetical protein IJW53_00505 [Clostridia bacterium]|nr:hypothetical protein [Clostridia bacterium]